LFVALVILSNSAFAQPASPTISARDLYIHSGFEDAGETAHYVGIRYSVLLFSKEGKPPQAVDPERVFRSGECIAVELQANRAGYLYVLAGGPSGNWAVLLPSGAASDEPKQVAAGVPSRVPLKDCFEFTQPSGTERLFLVLLRDRADVKGLLETIKLSPQSSQAPNQADRLEEKYASSDPKSRRIERANAPGDPPFTVYAVAAGRHLSVEIKLRHE
jgi:hypothetical protein